MLENICDQMQPLGIPYIRKHEVIYKSYDYDIGENAGKQPRAGEKTPGPTVRPEQGNRHGYCQQQIAQYRKITYGSDDRPEMRQSQIYPDGPQVHDHQESQPAPARQGCRDSCYRSNAIQSGSLKPSSSSLQVIVSGISVFRNPARTNQGCCRCLSPEPACMPCSRGTHPL